MIHTAFTRRVLRNAIGAVILPLAGLGCQHSQIASTEPDSSITATSEGTGHGIAQASRNSYHAVANGASEAGSSIVDITTNSAVRTANTPPETLSAAVINVDPAMQVRDWDVVSAGYSSGATVAGTTGFLYQPRDGQDEWRYQVIGIPLFLIDTALIPVAFIQIPPWKPVEWKGATVAPTYTAVPPLPPE
jgi:hypothetical protein